MTPSNASTSLFTRGFIGPFGTIDIFTALPVCFSTNFSFARLPMA
jgi:hypothetical protein